MSSTAVETRHLSTTGPPDFSFPPKYAWDAEETTPKTTRTLPQTPQTFGYPLHDILRNPTPTPTELPDIMTPLTPLSPDPIVLKPSRLLTIPLEIRLQIYDYVLFTHPIQHAHLSPITDPTHPWAGARKSEFHTTLLRPLGLSHPDPDFPSHHQHQPHNAGTTTTTTAVKPLLVTRTQGKIPTGLLASCRQVYEESRMLPWERNEFAFVNWFWSGVYAARQFSRGVRGWQSQGMRWCTLEVLGRDLWIDGMERLGGGIGGQTGTSEGKSVGEWRELCGFWKGVWGLRLRVKGSMVREKKGVDDQEQSGWNGEDGAWRRDEVQMVVDERKEESVLDVESLWVSDGLTRMKGLRWIQLEIEDEAIQRDVKLSFCGKLEQKLTASRSRGDGWEGRVQVIFVEKVKVSESVPNKNFAWYGGEPGDDSIWGLDV